jgi:Cu(I)/Ag(I) efflux system membrane fusion protein
MALMAALRENANAIAASDGLESARTAFLPLSAAVVETARQFGVGEGMTAYIVHCPMADGNRGADWLQPAPEVENPFFGSSMFACGEVNAPLSAGK